MKWILLCLAAASGGSMALPGDPPNPAVMREINQARADEERNPKVKCEKLSELARTIMDSRQSGISMAVMMAAAPEGNLGPLYEMLVTQAYEQPRYSTSDVKWRVIDEFENSAYLKCIKASR